LSTNNKTETQHLLALAIPTILAQLAQTGLGVIDTIMAGNYSPQALAAIAIGLNLFNPIMILVIGIVLSINPIAAQLNGDKQYDKIRRLFHNGIVLSLLLVIPSIILLRNCQPLMRLIGIEESLITLSQGYLDALSWGLPGFYLFFALRFINEGLFANKIVMYVAISALPLNVVLNQWFIYGGFGLPEMGAVGTGWATTVSYFYMFAAMLIYTAKTKRYDHIKFFSRWHKPDIKSQLELLKLGVPMGLSLCLEVALFAAVGLMIGTYTIAEIAGHQIALNISSITYMLPLGLSIAITSRVGYHIGRNQPLMAKNTGYLGIIMSFITMIFSVVLFISFPTEITSLYTDDQAVITVSSQLLFFAALFQLSDGIQVSASGALRGLKDTKIPLLICGVAYWIIGFPLGYWFAEELGWGVKGYWIAMISGLSVAAILLAARFYKLINSKTKAYMSQ
jgi:MATE family multidrug resistance protein